MLKTFLLLASTCIVGCLSAKCTDYSTQAQCSPITPRTLPDCGQLSQQPQKLFAFIGDYGLDSAGCEANVAGLVTQLETQFGALDFVATVGDNNYWNGECTDMINNVDKHYARYVHSGTAPSCTNPPPSRRFDAEVQRFFPTLGNHDWDKYHSTTGTMPYLQYFNYLPALGNQGLYYNVSRGSEVELFALNSNYEDSTDPKFIAMKSWLQGALGSSRAKYKIVYFHHPPYTTAQHDPPGTWMRWPFKQWGADLVMSGHQHTYERLLKQDGLTYVVNGLGGHHWLYSTAEMQSPQCDVEPGSVIRYNKFHGAMLGGVDHTGALQFCFYSVENGGTLVDSFNITAPTAVPTAAPSVPMAAAEDEATEVLLIGAGIMTALAVLALAVGLFLRRRLQSNPASLFESSRKPTGWSAVASMEPPEQCSLFESKSWAKQRPNHVDLRPDDFTHLAL